MTIASAVSKAGYAGNGSTTVFPVPFAFVRNADVEVVLRGADGAETVLAESTHYTLAGAGSASGGTLTLLAPPAGASPDGTDDAEILAIRRAPRIVQETDYQENDPFPAQSHEAALDLLTMICQSLDERLSRAVLVPLTSSETPPSPEGILTALAGAGAARDTARAWAEAAPGTPVADGAFSARHHATAAATAAAEAAQSAAAAAAVAGLPVIGAEDAGKVVGVNATADGFVLLDFSPSAYKAPAPVLTGALTVLEGAAIALAIADHEDGDVYEITDNPLGLEPAGTAITGTAPDVAADAGYTFALRRVRPDSGLLYSDATTVSILVQNVPVIDDPEGVAWANDAEDWPEVDRTGVSVGTGQMAVDGAVLAEFGVDAASTVSSLALTHVQSGMLAVGDVLVLDGDTLLEVPSGASEEEVPGVNATVTPITTLPDPYGSYAYTFIGLDQRLGNGKTITHLGASTTTAAGVTMLIARADGNGYFTRVASVVLSHTGSGTFEYAALTTPFTVPDTGDYYVACSKPVTTMQHLMQYIGHSGVYYYEDGLLPATSSPTGFAGNYGAGLGWKETTTAYKNTIPCSLALAAVPTEARRLPALSLASGAAEEAFTAPDDFAALPPASVSRSGDEFTVTCAPVALAEGTRRIAVGLAGGGWSAYSDGEDQDAAQGDWTRATVSVVLGADFFKTAAAATLMEE